MPDRHIIPAAALAQHIAIVGKTGAGKTNTTKLAIEQVVPQGARVCVLDPIKSDHWGLISHADGKRPGLPFQVLGGPHAHVPLHAGAGGAIAELVARGDLPLSIIDAEAVRAMGAAVLEHLDLDGLRHVLLNGWAPPTPDHGPEGPDQLEPGRRPAERARTDG